VTDELAALIAHARWLPAEDRAALGESWADAAAGTLLVTSCHRVELYGRRAEIERIADGKRGNGYRLLLGDDAARHLVKVAVGRDSAVVAEDQILHQLRLAAQQARATAALPTELDRLLDVALRAGRRARSWLPSRRPTLADVALARVAPSSAFEGRTVLVVGSGEMGRAALRTLVAQRATVLVASRSVETARALAECSGATAVDFDPGAGVVAGLDGVVIALNGQWVIAEATRTALATSSAWVADMSSPPAIDRALSEALSGRLTTIDDLADDHPGQPSTRLVARLDALIDDTVAEFDEWQSQQTRRSAADALAARAREVRSAELELLWRRAPSLGQRSSARWSTSRTRSCASRSSNSVVTAMGAASVPRATCSGCDPAWRLLCRGLDRSRANRDGRAHRHAWQRAGAHPGRNGR